jgi:outer membrane receptor protein involved in Fe transport
LGVAPTDKQYDIFGGLKGKLSNAISYNVRGSLVSEKNKPLYISNLDNQTTANKEDYQYGNSFEVVYDDIKTLGFFGEIKAEFSKNISLGINGNFSSFTKKNQDEAWNLPAINLGANVEIEITPKWYAGANVFFVGDRKDLINITKFVVDPANIIPQPLNQQSVTTLKSYFDANAHLGFKYTDRITAFLRLNNIGNQGYQRWLNFPVQSFQFMLGANYKFDF